MKTNKRLIKLSLVCIFSLVFAFLTTAAVTPVDYGPGDVIAAVNSLRAEYGLPAYDTSSALSQICQEQAEYMASINTLTHDRADGSSIPTTAENIAYGPIDPAMASWVDDQPHFDTLIAWSTAQAGAGIAESGGSVYICLNISRYSDTEFNQIPFTQGPGEEPVPELEPTEISVEEPPEEESVPENTDEPVVLDDAVEETPIPVAVVDDSEAGAENEVIEDLVTIEEPEQQSETIAIQSNTGQTIAYVLMGIGITGLGGSIYGMMSALRLMRENKPKSTNREKAKKMRQKNRKNQQTEPEEVPLQVLPNEAQEE